jgi:PKD repeat protein
VTPSSPVANTAATFNASTSTVGTGATITQYAWDFGDGGATVTSTTPAVQKIYGAAGSYLVTLTITDSLGRQATRVSTVTVLP